MIRPPGGYTMLGGGNMEKIILVSNNDDMSITSHQRSLVVNPELLIMKLFASLLTYVILLTFLGFNSSLHHIGMLRLGSLLTSPGFLL